MKKLKLIILLMLALLLVACGGATPSPSSDTTLKPGGGTTPKPGIEEVVKDEVEKEEFGIIDLDKGKKEAIKVLNELTDKVGNKEVVTYEGNELILGLITSGSYKKFKINYKEVVKIHGNKNEISDYELKIDPNVHLIIDENIEHKEKIGNFGNMYFIDDNVNDFTLKTPLFINFKNIYVIGKDGGSTLTIDGDYDAPSPKIENGVSIPVSDLYLGLYVRNDNTITTDKVLITGKVNGAGTNVRFVYNETDLENHKYPKAKADDYVIRVEKEVKIWDDKDKDKSFQMDNISNGLSSYELKASKNSDGATEWKLKKIE